MAIVKRPNRNPSEADKANRFITAQAEHPTPAARGKRVPVIVRFDPTLLAKVDEAARRRGVSRSGRSAASQAKFHYFSNWGREAFDTP
jgi:hypothetical protein